jgi:dTDP-4-dehydrorhamnose 3,5-epimerase
VSLQPTALAGVYLLQGRRVTDERGSFRKVVSWADSDLPDDVDTAVGEIGISENPTAGTLRGLHFQAKPHAQTKTVWVTRGVIFDVVVDLRRDQPTFGSWESFTLSAENMSALYLPCGVAHGFQTQVEDTVVTYAMGGAFAPDTARTLLWNDPAMDIPWPLPVTRMSENDRNGTPWPQLIES